MWKNLGLVGLNFLNIIPKLGKVTYEFFGNLFTDLFHGIYEQQIEPQKAKKVMIAIASVAVVASIAFSGINYLSDNEIVKKPEVKEELKKQEIKKPEIKKEVKKPLPKKLEQNKDLKKNQNLK